MPYKDFLASLESGQTRVAQKIGTDWQVNIEVKQKILEVFKNTKIVAMNGFRDKEALTARTFTEEDNVRMVPGGTSVRAGAHIGKNVVIMPPSYVNIGAYVDEQSMVDSHVLVGSCAQIGKRVHLSTAVQIGGVLEPIGNRPVIVEDDCFVGAGVILTEGIIVREKAVLAPGVKLSASVPIYDIINQTIIKGEIPVGAVVVPGTRPILSNNWAKEQNLSIACAVIIKHKDEKTSSATALENILR
ncbi:MAG: 2,3,4,5-tetrahydropyridine-2,6-dicarboxylate N-succinyltransferase [Candidatus Midichloria mitochondrii]|uniref:2,3,4,5-tetrahydropyridine-2-carboxylate N-succinyltransferase n=1 Tax=Midichloria mitochondrii (strain IricVA) TaxID=696127 RepID=F7XVB0_MIDMI|nr:2,3,4,5-tetrahydropyridine-2,6-dicarboxylate N-succinyltransferase [Candidatus Midichloria mitochondrii]AEI88609.1 2,3,4,5-tetrahydropyridine-2-carboxylate N-succinyltransferase [Candidatus Midichloria mitochondrii IricVA]MDJ1256241.1 2,3,4,5-tetrahydropyridine-2,6-dicarboxylate N-succinyltransferase [Candidatus Midichloria mitochondrii]MDJ1287916.1 2,3,4,5-tetrahydropyridine-2,6-dicarboxylate N-succinyltransferase [Candidatus Midichloria mitochondrii]MDJ1298783.1 2,3,4,5-tetrahydropyridine-